MYYLLQSDNLNIEYERYIIYFLYKYAVHRSEKEIRLLINGIRFAYVEIDVILDLIRDHVTLRNNKLFKKKVYNIFNSRAILSYNEEKQYYIG